MIILRQAKEVKMMEDYQSYLITSLVRWRRLYIFNISVFIEVYLSELPES